MSSVEVQMFAPVRCGECEWGLYVHSVDDDGFEKHDVMSCANISCKRYLVKLRVPRQYAWAEVME